MIVRSRYIVKSTDRFTTLTTDFYWRIVLLSEGGF